MEGLKQTRKKKRTNKSSPLRGSSRRRSIAYNGSDGCCDWMVVLPNRKQNTNNDVVEQQFWFQQLHDRLVDTGYTHMALTHIVYGRPRLSHDQPTTALPDSLWKTIINKKRRRVESNTLEDGNHNQLHVLRRLHAVVENLSDVGVYVAPCNTAFISDVAAHSPASASTNSTTETSKLLQDYDLVSISATNEAAFQSACVNATACDIVTLDYFSTRGLSLPYKIQVQDLVELSKRNACLEIPLAPALLNLKHRKALMQTCRELQQVMSSMKNHHHSKQKQQPKKRPLPLRILFSSGSRNMSDVNSPKDAGPLAIRRPGDLMNLITTILQLDTKVAYAAFDNDTLQQVLQDACHRKKGKGSINDVLKSVKKTASSPIASTTFRFKGVAILKKEELMVPSRKLCESDDDRCIRGRQGIKNQSSQDDQKGKEDNDDGDTDKTSRESLSNHSMDVTNDDYYEGDGFIPM